MQYEPRQSTPMDSAEQAGLVRAIMGRQARLSLRVAVVFLVLIFGLPLVNWLLPEVAQTRVLGFPLTWLFLAVLFYPLTWALSGYFVRESDRLEEAIVAEQKAKRDR